MPPKDLSCSSWKTLIRTVVADYLRGNLREDGPLLAKPYDPIDVERRIRALLAAGKRGDPSLGRDVSA